MSRQLELVWPNPRARRSDPRTSHAAAASMRGAVGAQRAAVLAALHAGPLTADEIDDVQGWRPTTAGRRLPELEAMGLVRRLPETALTRSGRQAHRYALVEG